ncbi:hypothetical protein KC19_2G024300 [Ceratodon purpureus]|uniref:Uncharacterized protein n=1 Tax=Ceratodon purpureus TaxID=3225 RepID=A0A8T0IPB4_CERPU|nr:hypothetical protein KC19_2G024300 [Ceratodon purpureus]
MERGKEVSAAQSWRLWWMGRLRSTNVGTSLMVVVLLSLLTLKWTEVISVANYAYTSARFSPVRQVWADDGFGFGILGVPWCRSRANNTVIWTRAELLQELSVFAKVYETRPIINNLNGMGFDHSFGLWFIARKLQPALAIESGVFKGHSTWILRQALPNVPIVALSPRHPRHYSKKSSAYVDSNCQYFTGKRFTDFGHISWSLVLAEHKVKDPSTVLVFFDDHQNQLRRIEAAQKYGFQHLVFEDNYDTGTGDHYSMRQICDQYHVSGGGHDCFKGEEELKIRNERQGRWEKAVNMSELCGDDDEWWGVQGFARDDFGHSFRKIPHSQHFENGRFVGDGLDVYWEVPPVASPILTHQTRYDPARTVLPLLLGEDKALFQELGLQNVPRHAFNGYTQMAYVKLLPASLD